ncbi:unnamed protein product [Rotaria magnacalcarata]|uniref:PPC domain-containing protein n=1 Tax=Rotaria magnacalcarata TaxID=392030 RepID=A0A816ZQK7_9BILA|nr:unnamed protein product [Rotaria magnacalcarata]CAF2228421.1 unnamed protein product [Rotaria magnacalcarata]CAF3720035.1 unnamed protein product [Rotaria magnacalcarata]
MSSSVNLQPISSSIRVFPLRLSPNMDVLSSIRNFINENSLQSVFIMTCVGSVKACRLRMANSIDVINLKTPHEIVSLVGTFDSEAQHIHGSFSDQTGRVIGGHVMADNPMIVYTTVEIVLAECENVIFSREMDNESGYPELIHLTMTSTENAPTPNNDPGSFSSFRSTNNHDTPNQNYSFDSTPPIHSSHHQRLIHSQNSQSLEASPSIVRNPSPPPIDNLSRADMVGDEMYSKSWFCQVLLKLIKFVAPQQIHKEAFSTIRQQGDDFLSTHSNKIQELDETFESELCELWDVSMSADVAHLLIQFNSLDLFNVVLIECKDKRCTEIVLGILSNMACCKRNLIQDEQSVSVALCIIQHTNLFSTILSILTSDDYSDCPTLVQLFRLIYTLTVRQDTRSLILERIQLTYEPLCFIFQSCINKELLEQCSCLLRVLLDECNLFEHNEQSEVFYLFLTSITTATSALIENETVTENNTLENLFNCLQIYTTNEHFIDMLNEHCQTIMKLTENILNRLVHDDIVQIRSVLLLSCISICNYFLFKHGLTIVNKELLQYFIIIGHTCYKDKQRREHQKHVMRRERSRTHSHSSNKRKDGDEFDTNGDTVDDDSLSKSHHAITNADWDDDIEVQSTTKVEFDRSTSEDLATTSYTLVDELFLELFYRGIKQDASKSTDNNPSLFKQLSQDQRETFRKIIKHFCHLDKRLDNMLEL